MENIWSSWNGNIRHSYENLFFPDTENEIVKIVKNAQKLRVVGTGKSSADIAAGTSTLVSLEKYNQILSIDHKSHRITVQSGILLKTLLQEMEKNGLAFPALPDIDDITVGGAIATGTHGTGKNAQSLSEYIVALKMVNASGEIDTIQSGDPALGAYKISLGLLGVITEITFQCIPRKVMSISERPMKDDLWLAAYKRMLQENDFLRILWLPHTGYGYVITGNYVNENERVLEKKGPWYYSYRRAVSKFLYQKAIKKPARIVTANKILKKLFFSKEQQKFGSLYDATVTKSRGSTLELAEWTVDIDRFDTLFFQLKKELNNKTNNAFVHIPMDVRFMKAETGWLANGLGKNIVTMGCVTRNAEEANHYKAFELVENLFLEHDGRPHWAKRFQCGRKVLNRLYPNWQNFVELRQKRDPEGKFLNAYLEKIFI
ncbi:MAG: FAD-binding protein [Candidatus Marinimicrobia bacterium]|nr:FAD-binding protein [Candidatus Neomarinimicrobiota bacterium]